MAKIHLEVTQQDIDGAGYGATCCPIAKAILRTFGGREGEASVGAQSCGLYRRDANGNYSDDAFWRANLPSEGIALVANWDKTYLRPDWLSRIHPVTLELEVIEGEGR